MEESLMNFLEFVEGIEVDIFIYDSKDFAKLEVICDLIKRGAKIESLAIGGRMKYPFITLEESDVLLKLNEALSVCSKMKSLTISIWLFVHPIVGVEGIEPVLKDILPSCSQIKELTLSTNSM